MSYFLISLIYSYIKPSDVVENIETKQQITIYVEGEIYKKSSLFPYKPQIKDVLNELQVENIYHFEETTQLASESVLYLPYGEHLISLNSGKS